jgi:transposase
VLGIHALPNDVEGLKRLVIERETALRARDVELREKQQQIEHLKFQLAKLRRARFGQSSEQLEGHGQLPLTLEELQVAVAEAVREAQAPSAEQPAAEKGQPVRRKQLPEHFERIAHVIEPRECVCPDCGGALKALGKPDEAEVLEVKTVTFTVTRHIRPKKRCSKCSTIVQAPAASRPLQKSFAGASLLALILTWKYGFHLPLYRQCQIFAQTGLTISRTTLMQWVGASSALLGPLVAALGKYVLSASNLNADDTPIKVLAPGTGKTKKGHLWTYVRDGRPWKSTDPPAVWYQYSPSWHGKYPQKHLATYRGKLQVDGYAGFDPLFVPPGPHVPARILEVACAAHMRRKFFDLHVALKSPLAKEALDRFGHLYQLEEQIRGRPPEERLAVRQTHAVPLLNAFHAWMLEKLGQVEKKSELAAAFHYALNNWEALVRYTQDGRLEMDNSAAERSIRGIGVGRRNYLFFGSDSGGERAAIIYALVETCKLNRIDPQCYLQYVLERIADHPINRIEELLPWNVADKLNQPHQVTQALAA